jgi:hypothetical protein
MKEGDKVIVFERENSFVLVNQHDHAKVSGKIAHNWKNDYFHGFEKKQEVVLAIYEHDRGWIDLDADPLWNDHSEKPYSFMDYPLEPKIASYRKGIDEVEQMNSYAGLLCSLHFTSFLTQASNLSAEIFLKEETVRQDQLADKLGIRGNIVKEQELHYHLAILKFCDNLSLYICLNEPGVSKSNEHPFYREGLPQTFPFTAGKSIIPRWVSMEDVSLSTSPFAKGLRTVLAYKEVKKDQIKKEGFTPAFKMSPTSERIVRFF